MKKKANGQVVEPEVTEVVETEVTEEPVAETIEEPEVATIEDPEYVEGDVVATGVVITGALNVRKGPGTEYLPIGTLYKGTEVEYVTENEEWLKLMSGGYVMKKFIQ